MPQDVSPPVSRNGLSADNALRVLLLTSFYAGAVFFAVVFSPSMGFSPHQHGPLAVASQSAALR
ncbi:hypothetical protein MTBLM5_90001 [Magnetospirillum sp. LM-5]|uniref:hypothetical protein n=1 Tax=Magnetospirillum sp. LM-5 TaxID=2681466 RepID=UPI00137EFB05|nr:hypothetical protein [Magnetospirillum sp. LM-5]CAA7625713.1 hypothetical protein MTBLM5_90001 [Magnetospirillum sp. LM-5]